MKLLLFSIVLVAAPTYAFECEDVPDLQRQLISDIQATVDVYVTIKEIGNPNLKTLGLFQQLKEQLLLADKLSFAQRFCRMKEEKKEG